MPYIITQHNPCCFEIARGGQFYAAGNIMRYIEKSLELM